MFQHIGLSYDISCMLLVWLLFEFEQSHCPTLRSICSKSNAASQDPPSTSTILIFPPASKGGESRKGQNLDHSASAFALQQPTSNTHFVCDLSTIPLPRSNPPQLPARCMWPQNAGQPMNSETSAPKGGFNREEALLAVLLETNHQAHGLVKTLVVQNGELKTSYVSRNQCSAPTVKISVWPALQLLRSGLPTFQKKIQK